MKKLRLLLFLAVILVAGIGLRAQEVTRTLMPGWTWISCPTADTLDFATAMGSFVPMQNDIITTQGGAAVYMNGRWVGTVSRFYPGYGYHYKSNRAEFITVTFQSQQPILHVVTTLEPIDITVSSAIVGGTVTLPEGSHVFLCGVCWGTEPNPGIDGNHTIEDMGIGSFSSMLEGLNSNTAYFVRAYAVSDYGLAYGNEVSFITEAGGSGDDHAYVDLGLPSGLLWATCNVGADSPEDYGDYFAWGETTPKDVYDWSTYQYCNGTLNSLTKYCNNIEYGYNGFSDNLTILLPEDDAATANWGTDWRIPTEEEWQELYNNTICTWTIQNGISGRLFTASNGNCLFLSAAGDYWGGDSSGIGYNANYWSSSLNTDNPASAWGLYFHSDNYSISNRGRCSGLSVRPVRSSLQNNIPTGAIDGKFTTNDNGDQIYFSQGNLQYQASTNIWKFADNQYDYIGDANDNLSSFYDGWIDLFGWGTSGYHDANDPYNVNYQPWSSSDSELNNDYNVYGYGPSTNMPDMSLTGTSANYDWGVNNPISNGGNTANQWRTLTRSEWNYVLNTRTTTSGIRFAKAQVNDVNGVILLPDDWTTDTYTLNNTNSIGASYISNVINASQWGTIENAGGVFLPAVGGRFGTTVDDVGTTGFYWLSSSDSICCACYVYIYYAGIYIVNYRRHLGRSVRLVCDVEN